MSACSSSGPSAWIASAGAASGSSKILRTDREKRSGGWVVFIRVSAVSCRRCRTNATNWYAAKTKPPTTVAVEIRAKAICSSAGIASLPRFQDDAPMPRVAARDVELYYESLGEGTPMVLQAHDHTPWLFCQAPVFSLRYRFLTYDRRGTGRSSSPPGDWTAADLANDLAGLLDALDIDKAIVGGSSLGGVVTAQFAVDHRRLARVGVVDPRRRAAGPAGRAPRRAARGRAGLERGGAGFPRSARPGWTIEAMTIAARAVRAPRGTTLACRAWPQEAAFRMIQNNLDPEVAEKPDELIVYGGTGRAARPWKAVDRLLATPPPPGDG